MIRRLRRKLIAVMMVSLAVVLAVIICALNVVNYQRIIKDSDSVLDYLAQNGGTFPDRMDSVDGMQPENPDAVPVSAVPKAAENDDDDEDEQALPGDDDDGPDEDSDDDRPGRRRPGGDMQEFSPELPYESRYFSVLLREDGTAVSADTGRIAAVDTETALAMGEEVCASGRSRGFSGQYRYLRYAEDDHTRVLFLDCGRLLDNFRSVLTISILAALGGLAAVFLLVLWLSGMIVRPVSESYEKQKRFITDAGHEIKTPLAIIDADVSAMESESGSSEWLDDIRVQTKRLAGLTNDLIFLSRMEEARPDIKMLEFPLSDVAEETARSFQSMALTQDKDFSVEIEPMITLCGEEKSIRQLIGLLLDNALKYSPEKGLIRLTLSRQGKNARLVVENTSSEEISRELLGSMFDRFYRADKSRNQAAGGYGIGLSIARAVVEAHRGRLSSSSADGRTMTVTVLLPLNS